MLVKMVAMDTTSKIFKRDPSKVSIVTANYQRAIATGTT